MRKEILTLGALIALLFATLGTQSVLAVNATLYGEVTDDGGDPNLYVWFQYGKTTAYGYETPRQTKYGTGEFSATVTGLEMCTTYYYRAVAKHVNYDDTKYGEGKSFTTECPVKVDLKVNSSDGPVTVSYKNRTITLSWTSEYANTCTAETVSKPSSSSVNWSGTKSTSGTESVTLDKAGNYTFKLTCRNNTTGSSNSDTVQVTLEPPTLSVITKGVVITY